MATVTIPNGDPHNLVLWKPAQWDGMSESEKLDLDFSADASNLAGWNFDGQISHDQYNQRIMYQFQYYVEKIRLQYMQNFSRDQYVETYLRTANNDQTRKMHIVYKNNGYIYLKVMTSAVSNITAYSKLYGIHYVAIQDQATWDSWSTEQRQTIQTITTGVSVATGYHTFGNYSSNPNDYYFLSNNAPLFREQVLQAVSSAKSQIDQLSNYDHWIIGLRSLPNAVSNSANHGQIIIKKYPSNLYIRLWQWDDTDNVGYYVWFVSDRISITKYFQTGTSTTGQELVNLFDYAPNPYNYSYLSFCSLGYTTTPATGPAPALQLTSSSFGQVYASTDFFGTHRFYSVTAHSASNYQILWDVELTVEANSLPLITAATVATALNLQQAGSAGSQMGSIAVSDADSDNLTASIVSCTLNGEAFDVSKLSISNTNTLVSVSKSDSTVFESGEYKIYIRISDGKQNSADVPLTVNISLDEDVPGMTLNRVVTLTNVLNAGILGAGFLARGNFTVKGVNQNSGQVGDENSQLTFNAGSRIQGGVVRFRRASGSGEFTSCTMRYTNSQKTIQSNATLSVTNATLE